MNNRSRSTLFLIEQLIVIAVFAVCAAACTKILTSAYFSTKDSRDLSNAIHAAESCAESFKATGGDFAETAKILGGSSSAGGSSAAVIYYNERWLSCNENEALYKLRLNETMVDDEYLSEATLSIEKITGEVIISFPVAARLQEGGAE